MIRWNAEDIKDFRNTHKLTRKKLGNFLGVDALSVYRWEKGLRTPSKTVMLLLDRIKQDFEKKKRRVRGKGNL